jgi:hypothetical protein
LSSVYYIDQSLRVFKALSLIQDARLLKKIVNDVSEKFMMYKAVEELNQLHVWRGRVDGIIEY